MAAIATLVSFALVVYSNFGLRGGIHVVADMGETMRRVVAAESRFRLSMALDLAYCAGIALGAAALYVILRSTSRLVALSALLLKLLYAGTSVLMVLSLGNVATLATNPNFQHSEDTLHAMMRLQWRAAGQQYYVGLTFWAFSATLFAWLWLRSRFIPRPLAIFGLVMSAWCLFCAVAYIIEPAFSKVVNLWLFDVGMALFDMALSVWLLTGGLRLNGGSETG
ncbi:MAG TPA: DUF4386 domain-containing protein [Candidatus Polarisedimenticolaceae bacterium]|nr:DUF4386 domain-containing protein [Candidatus Polarisedimenticolaceae bacterium]